MKKLLYVLLGLVILLAAGFFWIKQKHSPTYSGELKLAGLSAPVDVRFDNFGVPHIEASSAEDAYQALGYIHAMDRLFQMEMMRRVGTGTLAELLGPGLVNIDKFFRTLGIPQHAKWSTETWMSKEQLADKEMLNNNNSLSPEQKQMRKSVEAYIKGVNAFIEAGKLPLEYTLLGSKPREFTLNDMHAIVGYMSFTFASALKTDPLVTKIERQLGSAYLNALSIHTSPEHFKIPVHYPSRNPVDRTIITDSSNRNDSSSSALNSAGFIKEDKAHIALGAKRQNFTDDKHLTTHTDYENTVSGLLKNMPLPPFLGSNAWVIAPSHTASGKVLFSNDTHIGFSQPSVWYEAHIEYPGFSFYGNHLAGVPFALVGHSRHHSYGLTMFINDDMDLYEEKTDPTNSTSVLSGDSSIAFRERIDTILVKDSATVLLKIRETHHGPVMNEVMPELAEITSSPVSSWWVYLLEPTQALEATWKLSHAKTMQDVEAAARLIHAPGLNVMYGDSTGNIAWWAAAKLPIRPSHVNSKTLLNGSSGNDDILGWYAFENNPMSINPSSGLVISANNQPDTMNNGIFFPGYYYPGDRYERIRKTLSSRSDWSQENIKDLQTETINERHPQHAAYLLAAVDADRYKKFKPALDSLKNWRGTHELNDIAPTLYYKWVYHVLKAMTEDELGEASFKGLLETFLLKQSLTKMLREENQPWWDNKKTLEKETRTIIINKALEISLEELSDQYGRDASKWYWKESILSEHPHPLGAKKPLDIIFNVKTDPLEANGEGVNKLAFTMNGEGKYKVSSGPALRILLDFSNVDASESILPTGQSGNIFSPHYDDQAALFVQGKYRLQLMNKEDIEKTAKSTLRLIP